ncbi:hypothetical protein V6N13_100196 [Hibiscus sabdariffa]|uniref:Uncharacterized protein n=1 Tax=Hibiscus sabdariffa TaxID=183260 RepID=A0ABR2NUT6_9ROSI
MMWGSGNGRSLRWVFGAENWSECKPCFGHSRYGGCKRVENSAACVTLGTGDDGDEPEPAQSLQQVHVHCAASFNSTLIWIGLWPWGMGCCSSSASNWRMASFRDSSDSEMASLGQVMNLLQLFMN